MLISLTLDHWAQAAMLGEARRRGNEKTRHKSRDRGRDKNILGDLMGALGELVALEYYEPAMTPDQVLTTRQHMLHDGSGRMVKGADIETLAEKIDVKTFDCEPQKRFFAINAAKHKQLEGECDGYFALLTPRYGRQALIVDSVPHAAVSQWPCKSLGRYGDPSYNCQIQDFVRQFASQAEYSALRSAGCYSREEIGAQLANLDTRRIFAQTFPQSVTLLRRVA